MRASIYSHKNIFPYSLTHSWPQIIEEKSTIAQTLQILIWNIIIASLDMNSKNKWGIDETKATFQGYQWVLWVWVNWWNERNISRPTANFPHFRSLISSQSKCFFLGNFLSIHLRLTLSKGTCGANKIGLFVVWWLRKRLSNISRPTANFESDSIATSTY